MTALSFPSSPSLNQTYSSGGKTWKWNGASWVFQPINNFLPLSGGALTGALGIATTPAAGTNIHVARPLTGSVNGNSMYNSFTIQPDVTNSVTGFQTNTSTAASPFTLSTLNHYTANQGTFGAGSTVTSQAGFMAASTLTGATYNYGFYGNIASGTNRWNLYMNGTAKNYLGAATIVNGPLGFGAAASPAYGSSGDVLVSAGSSVSSPTWTPLKTINGQTIFATDYSGDLRTGTQTWIANYNGASTGSSGYYRVAKLQRNTDNGLTGGGICRIEVVAGFVGASYAGYGSSRTSIFVSVEGWATNVAEVSWASSTSANNTNNQNAYIDAVLYKVSAQYVEVWVHFPSLPYHGGNYIAPGFLVETSYGVVWGSSMGLGIGLIPLDSSYAYSSTADISSLGLSVANRHELNASIFGLPLLGQNLRSGPPSNGSVLVTDGVYWQPAVMGTVGGQSLFSGSVSFKTINGQSLIGSGNITISGSGGGGSSPSWVSLTSIPNGPGNFTYPSGAEPNIAVLALGPMSYDPSWMYQSMGWYTGNRSFSTSVYMSGANPSTLVAFAHAVMFTQSYTANTTAWPMNGGVVLPNSPGFYPYSGVALVIIPFTSSDLPDWSSAAAAGPGIDVYVDTTNLVAVARVDASQWGNTIIMGINPSATNPQPMLTIFLWQ